MPTRTPEPLQVKLDRHRIVRDGCWGWTACKNPGGYGNVRHGSKTFLAHRAAYLVEHGDLPDDAVVMHRCDNPECTNPAHLVLGTHGENVADKVRKGRQHRDLANPQTKVPERSFREVVIPLRESGMSLRQIAFRIGLSPEALRNRLQRLERECRI